MTEVKSVGHLHKLLREGHEEFFIHLGCIRSSKNICELEDGTLDVCNEITDTYQTLTDEELYTESNIGEAIDKGNFYSYEKEI